MSYAVALRYYNHEYHSVLENDSVITFGSGRNDTVRVNDFVANQMILKCYDNKILASAVAPFSFTDRPIKFNQPEYLNSDGSLSVYVSDVTGFYDEKISVPQDVTVKCGRLSTNDICIPLRIISRNHFTIRYSNNTVLVEDANSMNGVFVNGTKVKSAVMKNGDVLSVYTFRMKLEAGGLLFENAGNGLKVNIRSTGSTGTSGNTVNVPQTDEKKYIHYHYSPRIREQLPNEEIILSAVPGKGPMGSSSKNNFAYLVGSGAMMAASLASGAITPATLLMKAAGLISPVMSMANYSKLSKEEQQQLAEYEKLRQERYTAYINDQKARIEKIANVQRNILTAENPRPAECLETLRVMTPRTVSRFLWERRPADNDFLTARIGLGREKLCVSVKSRADNDGFKLLDDELEELAGKIIEETKYVENVPIRIDLRKYRTVGIVGPREKLVYLARNILVELTTEHSYENVRIAGIFDESDKTTWRDLRWAPHIWDESGQVRFISFDRERADGISEMLSDICKRRKEEASDAERNKKAVLPHYVIFVRSRNMIVDSELYDYLSSNDPSLGITTVFLYDQLYDLPASCQYIVDLNNDPVAYQKDVYNERTSFMPDDPVHSGDLGAFFRKMAAIELESRYSAGSIPSSITFLQGYGVNTVSELNIADRWNSAETYRTLKAPIGMMNNGVPFELDIRSGDRSHGPHGLLAGTTGSGKSELLQSWILSMAVNYHPHDVNFVIIDYKGGGMSDLMEPLPHVVGKITNIDRNITRSLISLKSELKRRQELFAIAGVNNIDKYQQAFQEGRVTERLPHLVIVTDEFAELKKEEPEFMAELNSVATVGRSLGIHLLLATQKPGGVVNDQISSNSRFRICMKVQDVADSREMLKRPDAAKITTAGRAYIRVGEDELFELFQSFYSGALYTGNALRKNDSGNQVRIVTAEGSRVEFNRKTKRKSDAVDELTAVIGEINNIAKTLGIEKLRGPWLPELESWIPLASLNVAGGFNGETWPEHINYENRVHDGNSVKAKNIITAGRSVDPDVISVPIGMYDVPQLQAQGIEMMDITNTGHFAIYGSPASGKTTLLKTLLLSLGMYYTPDEVNMYVLDAGNWTLNEFSEMPHVREIILNQEDEKISKFVKQMRNELTRRKKAFLANSVSSLTAYRRSVSDNLPAIIVIIDNIVPLFEQYPSLEEVITEIATNGLTYGIYIVFTSNSTSGIKYKLTQLVKGAITLQLADKGDYSNIVGPIASISLPTVPGSALMRGNPPVAFQTAIYIDEQDDQLRHEKLLELINKMKDAWNSQDKENTDDGSDGNTGNLTELLKEYTNRELLPIGRETTYLKPIITDMTDGNILTVSYGDEKQGIRAMTMMTGMLVSNPDNIVYVVDTAEKLAHVKLYDSFAERATYISENPQDILHELESELNARLQEYNAVKTQGSDAVRKWRKGKKQLCLIVNDADKLEQSLSLDDLKAFGRIFAKTASLGVMIICSAGTEGLSDTEEYKQLLNAAYKVNKGIAIGGMPANHSFLHLDSDTRLAGITLEDSQAVFHEKDKNTLIEIS